MRSEGFFTYSRGAYTNFLREERKMRKLFFARRAYSTHFTRILSRNDISSTFFIFFSILDILNLKSKLCSRIKLNQSRN